MIYCNQLTKLVFNLLLSSDHRAYFSFCDIIYETFCFSAVCLLSFFSFIWVESCFVLWLQGCCQSTAIWKCVFCTACSSRKVLQKHHLQFGLIKSYSHHFKSAMTLPVCFCCLYRDAKAMYSCEAEHSHELSFPQGAHFSNGEQS